MSVAEVPYKFLERSVAPQRGNVTQAVTASLRNAIVTLELEPGQLLDKQAICARLGVSRFPVSEALTRLQAEGLVDILPQRGSAVSLIRIADVAEFMVIRKALESEAVRILAARPSAGLIAALERCLKAQRAAAKRDDRVTFHAHDLEFHDTLFAAMDHERIRNIIDRARANLDRARRLILNPRRLDDTLTEHREIFSAIGAADPARAAVAMRAHIDNVMADLIDFAGRHPDVFADGDAGGTYRFPFG